MMLIGINSILSPDLRATLREMWHGDEIAIVDVNYPALEHARMLIRLGGLTLRSVMDAVSSGLPVNEIYYQIVKFCKNMYQKKSVVPLMAGDFYAHVENCHIVILTSKPCLYENLITPKGIIYLTEDKL